MRRRGGLHPAVFGHGQRLAVADDEMIKHPYVYHGQRIGEFARQLPIGLARLSHPGWVVMGVIVYAL